MKRRLQQKLARLRYQRRLQQTLTRPQFQRRLLLKAAKIHMQKHRLLVVAIIRSYVSILMKFTIYIWHQKLWVEKLVRSGSITCY